MNLDLTGRLYMFADDVYLFYPYKYDLSLEANMQRDIFLIFEFDSLNKLVLNVDKTKLVRFKLLIIISIFVLVVISFMNQILESI